MNTSWKAGIAIVDITPPVGSDLSGYAAREQGATGIHDSLSAKALVVSDGAERAAVVTCDLLGIDADDVERVRRKIEEKTRIKGKNVMIAASHTHSGPATLHTNGIGRRKESWVDQLVERLADCVAKAAASLEDVSLEVVTGEAFIGINRRGTIPEGSINPVPDPTGPVDRAVSVLSIKQFQTGRPRAVLFVHGCHATVLGGDNRLVSADYPGYAMHFVERALGPGVIAMFANGGAGDVNPVEMGSHEIARRLGEALGQEVVNAVLKTGERLEPRLDVSGEVAELPFAQVPSFDDATGFIRRHAAAVESSREGSVERKISEACLAWCGKLALAALEGVVPTKLRVEVQRISLGDMRLIGLPVEPFSETAMSIRRSLTNRAIVVGYANGNVGYLPTRNEIAKGGYEVLEAHKYYDLPSHFAPEAEENVLRAAIS